MYIDKMEAKLELNIDEKEYQTLKNQGMIVDRVVIDGEGFVKTVVDERQVELLKNRRAIAR